MTLTVKELKNEIDPNIDFRFHNSVGSFNKAMDLESERIENASKRLTTDFLKTFLEKTERLTVAKYLSESYDRTSIEYFIDAVRVASSYQIYTSPDIHYEIRGEITVVTQEFTDKAEFSCSFSMSKEDEIELIDFEV